MQVFTHWGATPPADPAQWQFETMTGRTTLDVTLHGPSAAAGTVWVTAFWFNGRKQTGGAGAPVQVNVAATVPVPQAQEAKMRIAA